MTVVGKREIEVQRQRWLIFSIFAKVNLVPIQFCFFFQHFNVRSFFRKENLILPKIPPFKFSNDFRVFRGKRILRALLWFLGLFWNWFLKFDVFSMFSVRENCSLGSRGRPLDKSFSITFSKDWLTAANVSLNYA